VNDPAIQSLLARAPHISQDEVLGHPRFAEARKLYLDRFLALYGADPFLVRLLIETGRFLVFHLAIILEASHDPARRETWFTVGRLKQQIAMLGIGASERQVDHLISRLRAVGFLEMLQSEGDRRVRLLKPTAKMLAHDRDWLAAHYAPLTVLCPHNDYGPVMERDPAFQLVQRRTSLDFTPIGLKLLLSEPDMMLFFDRSAGHMVLAALLHAALSDPANPHPAVPYADVGDRFGVSRTHVRELLATAEENGLVKLQARGGHQVEILPRLWASYNRAIAGGMFLHDLIYGAATGRTALRRTGT
jgi:DNA-binding MarR family transcriptional regulator/DNA-binding transcriptional ArsR family regulator